MRNLLAKKNGTSLVEHSRSVAEVATYIASKSLPGTEKELLDTVRLSALLHDIGKGTGSFQKRLTDISGEEIINNKIKFRHNEVGWAFLKKHLSGKIPHYDKVCDAVYWHHGITNAIGKNTDTEIYDTLVSSDISSMKEILTTLLTEEYLTDNFDTCVTPNYYQLPKSTTQTLSDNMDNSFIRMCVCSADRIVSMLEEENRVSEYKEHIGKIEKRTPFGITTNPYPESDRFENQREVVNKSSEKTTLIKAPAGFGKTLTGLMWASQSPKKLLWVCPRNSIATTLYESVLKELRVTGNENVTVELFLTNEVKKIHGHNDLRGLTSDITIMNIDSFLSPTVSYRGPEDRMYMVNTTDVIFDEFHELITREAMFGAFVNILRTRHRLTNVRTLLLSATPGILCEMPFLFSDDDPCTILPSKEEHYPAAHGRTYLMRTHSEVPDLKEGELIINNIIRETQVVAHDHPDSFLIHSEFTDDVKEDKYSHLINTYGKNGKGVRKGVTGSHVIQASMDISFRKMSESVFSPESTLQRIGRCNRWGDFGDGCEIGTFFSDDPGNKYIIKNLYDEKLNELWWEQVSSFDGKSMTLDELYHEYNRFNSEHRNSIKSHIGKVLTESLRKLSTIYPVKHWNTKGDTDVLVSGGNKLRESGDSIFYICESHDRPGEWMGPFTKSLLYDLSEEFEENRLTNVLNSITKVRKELLSDTRFNYKEMTGKHKRNITLDHLRKHARYSDTPYVRFDVVYNDRYGIIKKKLLNRLSE